LPVAIEVAGHEAAGEIQRDARLLGHRVGIAVVFIPAPATFTTPPRVPAASPTGETSTKVTSAEAAWAKPASAKIAPASKKPTEPFPALVIASATPLVIALAAPAVVATSPALGAGGIFDDQHAPQQAKCGQQGLRSLIHGRFSQVRSESCGV
jgi:hypothetical protein